METIYYLKVITGSFLDFPKGLDATNLTVKILSGCYQKRVTLLIPPLSNSYFFSIRATTNFVSGFDADSSLLLFFSKQLIGNSFKDRLDLPKRKAEVGYMAQFLGRKKGIGNSPVHHLVGLD